MKTNTFYIAIGITLSVSLLITYQQLSESAVPQEPLELPIVHLQHGKQAAIELEIKLAGIKPPLPNQYIGRTIHNEPEYLLQTAEEIPAIIFAEEPDVVYQATEVDIPAQPVRDLELLCKQLAKHYPKLIACKSKIIRFELVIHQDGSLIDWRFGNDPYSICEPISLIFISNIQQWKPARLNGKTVTQATSIHIHIN